MRASRSASTPRSTRVGIFCARREKPPFIRFVVAMIRLIAARH
jgi:hypothetical protein